MSGRALSSATASATTASTTSPGYFVEIVFPSGTVRVTTRDTVTWNGFVWVRSVLKVSRIEGTGQSGTLDFFDADRSLRTLVTQDGVNDRRVRVWKFYKGALATGDPALIFDGVGDGSRIAQGRVAINVARTGSRTLMSPRLRIGPFIGLNFLAPEGTIVNWAGRVIRLNSSNG